MNIILICVPSAITAAATAKAIPEAIIAYSIAVAALSFLRRCKMNWVIYIPVCRDGNLPSGT